MNYAAVNTKAVAVCAHYLKPQVPLKILEAGNYTDGLDIVAKDWDIELSEDAHLLEVNVKMEQKVFAALKVSSIICRGRRARFMPPCWSATPFRTLSGFFVPSTTTKTSTS